MNALIEHLRAMYVANGTNYVQAAADKLEAQAERIKELELLVKVKNKPICDYQELIAERDALRAQLAAIDATEPVCLIPDYELDYMQTNACGAVYKIGSDEAWDNDADIKLFTRPMPQIIGLQDVHDAVTADPTLADCAQDVTELVEALEKLARLGNGEHYGNSDGNMIARSALSKYKGAK